MDKKKTFLSAALTAATILASPYCIGKFLGILSKKQASKWEQGSFYQWRLGKIHYTVAGKGKPILLLHGIGAGCSHLEWKNNIEELSKNYRVYTIDLLGFGFSDHPKTTYTAYLYISLILDFIQNIIQQPVSVIASSTSSDFALMACHANSRWFKKMILIEPSGLYTELPQNKDKTIRRILEFPFFGDALYLSITSKKAIQSFLSKNILFSKEQAAHDALWKDYYTMSHLNVNGSKYALASFFSHFMNIDSKQAIKTCNVPLFFVWGEQAVLNPVEQMDWLAEQKPASGYAVFEETRQIPHYENPEEFNRLVKEFFH